jgi:SAM-dependent methyltransferase
MAEGSHTLERSVAARARCRFCDTRLGDPFLDLGMVPLVNAYRTPAQLAEMEPFYPLRVYVCERCFLVQLESLATPEELFQDYAYFSSFSDTWLRHASDYCAQAVERFGLNESHQVVEIASNDGYLLQYFLPRGLSVLGVEPAANVAAAAREKGVPTVVRFFGAETARILVEEGKAADLLIANNVLGHVPDLRDFLLGTAILLKPSGVATFEFPHLLRLVEEKQFDTIYHEHFSYFSLTAVEAIFAAYELAIVDLDEIPTHGGSLRIHVRHAARAASPGPRLVEVRERERAAGLTRIERYLRFAAEVREAKCRLLEFMIDQKRQGKSIAGYGAPAKATVLLNYCGIGSDFIDYTVDRSPHKQGRYLPGTRVPICHPDRIAETRPDYLMILPWNLREEVMRQMAGIRAWGGRFVVPIPEVQIHA